MLKRITKFSRRLGKRRDKKIPPSPAKSDGGHGGSGEVSDISERSSMPDLRVHATDDDVDASLDVCNNKTMNGDCDITVPIPVASSEESIIEETTENDSQKMEIAIDELRAVYLAKHADEDRLFREEMRELSNITKNSISSEYAKLPQNKDKNRYKNIITSDHSRVILQRVDDDQFSDYINASYIDGYSKKRKFIASQGPKSNTVNDFWRMVWEQKCELIVMVTDFRENGKQKCERYFPEEGAMDYGRIRVEASPVASYGGYVQRTIAMQHLDEKIVKDEEEERESGGEEEEREENGCDGGVAHTSADEDQQEEEEYVTRYVTHLQCKTWPDHGVPKTTSAIFRLYNKMNEMQHPGSEAPILIHCSAGVGRSGTLIGLDVLLDQLQAENIVNFHDCVVTMRKNRSEMVQSTEQYVLLHKLILEYYYLEDTDCDVASFEEWIEDLDKADEETGKSEFDSQFELLELVPPQNSRFGSGSLPQNKSKNRVEKIIPFEHSQIFIRMRPTEMRPPYVNASTLLGYDDTMQLIAAQDPYPNMLEEFWRVIIDNNVTCIVMVTPQMKDDVEVCPRYWPSDDVMEFGDITIKHEETIEHDEYVETVMTILTDDREKLGRSITHLQYSGWEEDEPPPENSEIALLEMVAMVDKRMRMEEVGSRKKILVHCSDGAGRTGVFCVISNLIQRLKCENKVDVFRTVKDLRDCRPCMVRTVEQYRFCHQAIATYLRSFELYSNER